MKHAVIIVLLTLAGCAGAAEQTYYQIDPQAAVFASGAKHAAKHAAIISVDVPKADFGLDNTHIQVQTADGNLTSVDNAAWIAPPAEMLQPIMLRAIEQTGFASVAGDDATATLALQISIERFTLVYAADASAPPQVEVALHMTLTRVADKKLLLSEAMASSTPLQEVRMSTVVPAFEQALAACVKQVTQKIGKAGKN